MALIYTLREAIRENGMDIKNTVASVQGFGNVAQYAIQLFTQLGGKVVAVLAGIIKIKLLILTESLPC
jgi:glutamate dehydrogenase (NAD(P)+)